MGGCEKTSVPTRHQVNKNKNETEKESYVHWEKHRMWSMWSISRNKNSESYQNIKRHLHTFIALKNSCCNKYHFV